MTAKKTRTHKILNKHPFIGALLGTAVFVPLFVMTTSLCSLIFEKMITDSNVSSGASILITFIIWSLIFLWWFRGETSGLIFGGDIKGCAVVAGLFVAFWALALTQEHFTAGGRLEVPTLSVIGKAVSAGFFEEPLMRGFIIMLLLRKIRTPKMITGSLIVTTIIFALLHFPNLSEAELVPTVTQVINSIGTGLAFGLLYVRSGNLLPAAIFHTIHDIIAFTLVENENLAVIFAGLTMADLINVILTFILGLLCFIYLRKDSVMKKIIAVWDKKWSGVVS